MLGNSKYRREYDKVYDGGYFIERIADQTFLTYLKSKSVAFVYARDWVLVQHYNQKADGTIYILAYSSDRDHLVPPSKDKVRAFIGVSFHFGSSDCRINRLLGGDFKHWQVIPNIRLYALTW